MHNPSETRLANIPHTIAALCETAVVIAGRVDIHRNLRDPDGCIPADWGDETSEGTLAVEEICDLLVKMPAQSLAELRQKAAVWRIIAPEGLFDPRVMVQPDQELAVSIMDDLNRLALADDRNGGTAHEAIQPARAYTGDGRIPPNFPPRQYPTN